MQDPEGWQRWAPFLERTRPRADVWPDGQVDGPPLVYLFADGIYSASHTHWLYSIEDDLRAAGCPGTARAFSYAGIGRPYESVHTRVDIQHAAERYVGYLTRLRSDQRLIAVGFSLGTVVTLLGVTRWLATNPAEPAATLPALVLVAPAHAASPRLLDSYRLWAKEDPSAASGERRRVPYVARQLAGPSSRVRADARHAFGQILEAGLQIHVLYWPADALTPYESPGRAIEDHPNFHPIRVRSEALLSAMPRAVSEHMQVRDHPDTVAQIAHILKVLG